MTPEVLAPEAPTCPPGRFVDPRGDQPIRAEVCGLESLEAHARELARAFRVAPGGARKPLLKRLRANGRFLYRARKAISESARRQEPLTPDAEWLIDNFYVIEEVLREVVQDLPRGYYDELPVLADGPYAGYPRVYALALELIAHTDGALDEAQILRFVKAYQTVAPLTIGELWAVPTMLRVGLLENLRRLAEQYLKARDDGCHAQEWAEKLLADPSASASPPMEPLTAPCIVGLLHALRDHGAASSPAIEWLEDWLRRHQLTTADVLRGEHQRQAANQVSIGNAVTSLRLLSALDWNEFFERASHVEAVLREDPTGVYPKQDFQTRDRYRRAIEQLARGTGLTEVEVARRAMERAATSSVDGNAEAAVAAEDPRPAPSPSDHGPRTTDPGRRGHLGYYLIDEGRRAFEAELGYRPRWGEWFRSLLKHHPNAAYFGSVSFFTAVLLAALLLLAWPLAGGWGVLLAALAFLPITDVAVGLTHFLVTRLLPPTVLPKLDFKDGIPEDCATFVVIPCLLTKSEGTDTLVEHLELHYLANPDPHLRFALLTDFADAPAEHMPDDEALVAHALAGIRALNERHAGGGPDRFFLFHRRRLYNPSQGCWMGYERKRGKLSEFNRLLRGGRNTSYSVISGDLEELPHIRYVLTLDADTVLPREAASKLIGTLAHPLNRPRFDPAAGRVVGGYGVLQPRVNFLPRTGQRSRFAAVYANSSGIDPYSAAVSDVYQDLFGRGTFTGKGLYEIDAFEAATGPAFPDNHILSHDLIEGNFARCGLVTDVEVFDEFPARYHAYARREHRWVRGDWQLLPWLGREVPFCPSSETPESPPAAAGGLRPGQRPNPLPLLERWKIIDNLRRSLVPPALIAALVAGWLLLPGRAWLWSLLGFGVLALPLVLQVAAGLLDVLRGGRPRAVFEALREGLPATAGQVLLSTVFLADQARLGLHAIAVTLARVCRTRCNMLEWETAAAAERRLGTSCASFVRRMGLTSLFAVAVGVLVGYVEPAALWGAVPLLGAWFLSPLIAYAVSRPRALREKPLSEAERKELRRVARKTWGFFDTFVGPEDNWLPPDNYQEDPKGQVAHRTSPTNMGLLLTSTLVAHDFGYLTLPVLAERARKTLETFGKLERFHGHFLNWYETRTLKTLQPGYVSTVDSGNLLGCLLALKQGCFAKCDEPIPAATAIEGLADTLALVAEELDPLRPPEGNEPPETWRVLAASVQEAQRLLLDVPTDLLGWDALFGRLHVIASALPEQVRQLAAAVNASPTQLARWAKTFAELVEARRTELAEVAPWLGTLREIGDALPPGLGAERATAWRALLRRLAEPFSIDGWPKRKAALLNELEGFDIPANGSGNGSRSAAARLAAALQSSAAGKWAEELRTVAGEADEFAQAMDFRFLFSAHRDLFAIGYNLPLGRLDHAHYDLLASEAAIASFLTVARGEVPKKHWFQLGRPVTHVAGRMGLLSWGGTMFEYLMPRLLLPYFPGTLLDMMTRTAVARQREYGRQNRVPWGISESAFNVLDASLDYQYQSFGVPGLGLKRGLSMDLVVAPYATALALPLVPHAALRNFRYLRSEGGEGPHGFYEAIDYTPRRLPKGQRSQVIRSYMAHHQGMTLVALANCLLGDVIPRRLHREPVVRSAELLLQERVPIDAPTLQPFPDEQSVAPAEVEALYPVSRRLTTANTPSPRTHLLSNGQYTVMVTNAGGGFSACRSLDITRWREDRVTDSWGQFVYVRDRAGGKLWSATHQPLRRPNEEYEIVYSIDKAEFRRIDGEIETHLEVTVAPDVNVEVRKLTLTNHTAQVRELEVVSYAEVVLGPHGGDLAHPAFGKLFLETEWVPASAALLCRRRPRSPDIRPVWALHVLATDADVVAPPTFETDRAKFLGRRRTAANPEALERDGADWVGSTGPVLDPVFSLRQTVRLEPGASAVVAFSTALADTREEALARADQFHSMHAVTRAFELAWAHSRVELRHLNLSVGEAHLYQRLAGHVLYAAPALRAAPSVIAANRQGQPALWRHGISGDYPIVLLRIGDANELPLVRQLLVAHTYWRTKGLQVDLIILNEHPTSYFEDLHQQLTTLARASDAHELIDKPGGVFVRKLSHLSEDDRTLLLSAARVVLAGDHGSLTSQVDVRERTGTLPPKLRAGRRRGAERWTPKPPPQGLLFANGFGGFTPDGREYVVTQTPPAPWINVIANPDFGCLVSDSGPGYTWFGNSQTNRLTPWSNDPVSDTPGEALYLRDEESGEFWSPTPLPVPGPAPTVVRHGQGYSVFEQHRGTLDQELTLFVAPDAPARFLRLRVRNLSDRPRKLSATFYAQWVLGTTHSQTGMYVVTELDADSGAVFARNAFNADFADAIGFADVSLRPRTMTGDRAEFLGRNGSVAAPAALERADLSGRVGAGLDPCVALQTKFELPARGEQEVVFVLGQAADRSAARQLARRYREVREVEAAFRGAKGLWDGLLSTVQVRTPDEATNVLLNRWLLYQVLSCRFWGRSAFYQSGGAFGFRDQLQDSMALVYAAPQEARGQLLRAAARQFEEGDVQHWWHPPSGRGVRTRFSDDFLWLPFVAGFYVAVTGDAAVLDERVHFLKTPPLEPNQEEVYGLPAVSENTATLYDHCVRSLDNGWKLGAHGLPLMGIGDWNDGMNRVGWHGKGESVWDAWFQVTCLKRFAEIAESRGAADDAGRFRDRIEKLRKALETEAWDGDWYRRAYFDDGTPLGSKQNDECRIDSLTQSWAVISGAGDPERSRKAMKEAVDHLVKPEERLILLFEPPFDDGPLQPGYIKGYVPGIRENGGQYTHAATWLVEAAALLGRGEEAFALFDLLSPVKQADTPKAVARYKVEPYVVAADIYSQPPHVGRGGWTWYTGSAAWLYRVGLEAILGFHLRGNRLEFAPCVPPGWKRFEVAYRHRSATYRIAVENPNGVERGVAGVWLDGVRQEGAAVELADDGRTHEVRVEMG